MPELFLKKMYFLFKATTVKYNFLFSCKFCDRLYICLFLLSNAAKFFTLITFFEDTHFLIFLASKLRAGLGFPKINFH